MAIQGNFIVSDLVNSDLPYAPPFSLSIAILSNAINTWFELYSVIFEIIQFSNFEYKQTLFTKNKTTLQPAKDGYGEGSFVVVKACKPY